MKPNDTVFWKRYISNLHVDLDYTAYTKVNGDWEDADFTPGYNKFYCILEGEGYLRLRGQTYYPRPGELYLLPAGARQGYGTISDNTFGKYWCHFTAAIGETNLFETLETAPFLVMKEPEVWHGKFEQLIALAGEDSLTSRIRLNAQLLELIAMYIEQSDYVKISHKSVPAYEKMSAVLHHIEANLRENITVDELAQIAHFHPNYFIRVFRSFTGSSPIQYIIRTRLERARHLLTVTEQSVSEIADSVGLELSYFSRIFRERYGLSPTSYRDVVPKDGYATGGDR